MRTPLERRRIAPTAISQSYSLMSEIPMNYDETTKTFTIRNFDNAFEVGRDEDRSESDQTAYYLSMGSGVHNALQNQRHASLRIDLPDLGIEKVLSMSFQWALLRDKSSGTGTSYGGLADSSFGGSIGDPRGPSQSFADDRMCKSTPAPSGADQEWRPAIAGCAHGGEFFSLGFSDGTTNLNRYDENDKLYTEGTFDYADPRTDTLCTGRQTAVLGNQSLKVCYVRYTLSYSDASERVISLSASKDTNNVAKALGYKNPTKIEPFAPPSSLFLAVNHSNSNSAEGALHKLRNFTFRIRGTPRQEQSLTA